MDDLGVLVPILAVGLPLLGWILGRIMKHRERMAMLRMGIIPPPSNREARRYGYGNAQQTWIPQPPPPGMPMGNFTPPPAIDPQDAAQCTLRGGVTTSMVGLALFIGFSFIGYHAGEIPPIRPGPWLLGGLIPMFVGVAQIINGLMQGATFSLRRDPGPGYGPPFTPPPPAGRGYGPPPPHPGQPGVHYEELARPVKPPDRI